MSPRANTLGDRPGREGPAGAAGPHLRGSLAIGSPSAGGSRARANAAVDIARHQPTERACSIATTRTQRPGGAASAAELSRFMLARAVRAPRAARHGRRRTPPSHRESSHCGPRRDDSSQSGARAPERALYGERALTALRYEALRRRRSGTGAASRSSAVLALARRAALVESFPARRGSLFAPTAAAVPSLPYQVSSYASRTADGLKRARTIVAVSGRVRRGFDTASPISRASPSTSPRGTTCTSSPKRAPSSVPPG